MTTVRCCLRRTTACRCHEFRLDSAHVIMIHLRQPEDYMTSNSCHWICLRESAGQAPPTPTFGRHGPPCRAGRPPGRLAAAPSPPSPPEPVRPPLVVDRRHDRGHRAGREPFTGPAAESGFRPPPACKFAKLPPELVPPTSRWRGEILTGTHPAAFDISTATFPMSARRAHGLQAARPVATTSTARPPDVGIPCALRDGPAEGAGLPFVAAFTFWSGERLDPETSI